MFSPAHLIVGILGLALLMIVHEAGHFFAARHFGMRVIKFSIGIGPTIWKYKPKDSPTVYQVAIIPFLAYVQIAGLNPYEEIEPNDSGSYANASLWARVVTIAAGPLVNYVFASVLIFLALLIGVSEPDYQSMRVEPIQTTPAPAYEAGMRAGDRIVSINDQPVLNWDDLQKAVSSHPGEAINVVVEREGAESKIQVTPLPKGQKDEGRIKIGAYRSIKRYPIKEAARQSLVRPPLVVAGSLKGMFDAITGRAKVEVRGFVGIAEDTAHAAKEGPGELLYWLGALSAYLGAFNLLPIPALDGGRLFFLGVEAAARRKPDAKWEAGIHMVGLLFLLAVMVIVTFKDVLSWGR